MSTTPVSSALQTPTGETMARPQRRLESIDGLRGLACLIVLLYHSYVFFGYIAWPRLSFGSFPLFHRNVFAYGYGGVDLFFVLSGFCLTYPIVSRPERPVDWKQYAVNRVRRIIPPYWAALLLFGCLSLWITHDTIQPFASQQILGWVGTRQVIYSVVLVSHTFNGSFWTLPVEWRWYFVLPALIWLWRRIKGGGVLLCLIPFSLVSIFLLMPSHQEQLKFIVSPLFSYMPLFGLGIWAASLAVSQESYKGEHWIKKLTPIGLAFTLIVVVMFAPLDVPYFGGVSVLLRLLTWGPFCFFLVLAATQEGLIRHIVSWHPLVKVGTFSYSLYLTHEPFLHMAAALILPHHWPDGYFFARLLSSQRF